MGLAAQDGVGAVELAFYGVVVELQITHHGQHVTPEAAQALPQQEEPVCHPRQLQVLLGLRARDAAVVEGQVGGGVRHLLPGLCSPGWLTRCWGLACGGGRIRSWSIVLQEWFRWGSVSCLGVLPLARCGVVLNSRRPISL